MSNAPRIMKYAHYENTGKCFYHPYVYTLACISTLGFWSSDELKLHVQLLDGYCDKHYWASFWSHSYTTWGSILVLCCLWMICWLACGITFFLFSACHRWGSSFFYVFWKHDIKQNVYRFQLLWLLSVQTTLPSSWSSWFKNYFKEYTW